jgi:serine/threonine-protein kinase
MAAKPELLGGRYEVGEVIGYGGMAEVHRGRDVRLGRDVAVKLLRADLSRDPAFEGRFRREAQSAASLNSPAIVAVYDTGEGEVNGVRTPYIVMEYVEGETLRDLLVTEGRLLPDRALEVTAAICTALEQAHAAGIVHRDIKPGNVMVTPSGEIKVMDFGIARALTNSTSTLTQTAAVIGTAHYLSPEQARGEHVDTRSDVYSTGCLLYELLTGTPPFTGDSAVAVAYQHVREDPTPPSMIETDIPTSIDAIVMTAMAKNPANRYATATDMRADIERARAGQPVLAVPVMAGDDTIVPTIAPTTVVVRERRKKRRGVAYVLLAAATVGVFVLALTAARSLIGHTAVDVYTPNLQHQTLTAAESTLRAQGFVVGTISHQFTDRNNAGQVVNQSPPGGSLYRKGQAISLTVSSGVHIVSVPDVVGLSLSGATTELHSAGLRLGKLVQRNSKEPPNQVLGARPRVGTSLPAGTAVKLVVSNALVKVPDVAFDSPTTAESVLEKAGFNPSLRDSLESTASNANLIVSQVPKGGTYHTTGSKVTIYVDVPPESPPPSSPPPTTPPPATGPTGTAKPQ